MRRIVLASASEQRKKLLAMVGVNFSVHPSRVAEKTQITHNCASLVKENALIKAQDVAAKEKNAIVIGADTLVYVGNKTIVGKPKNVKDAQRILKLLFSRAHWVYTGVAMIDTHTGKRLIDYEKTRIYMTPLNDKEIESYHKQVNPFDKAGGFDIEGWGSLFIRRIEGCYSNVIGLPMPKIHQMLKKMGVSILSLLCCFGLIGCATEYNLATGKEETYMHSTEKEVKIGEAVAESVEKQYTVLREVDVNERVQRILDKIVEVCDRKDIVYFIKVLDEDLLNAVSLPGGYIYIFGGVVDKAKNDDELASVIAHEVGHITARHGIKRLQNSYGYLLLQLASTQAGGNVSGGVNLALTSLFLEYSQQDEFQADELGIKYLKKAGYDPHAMVSFLEKLREEEEKKPLREYSYWRTHPNLPKRIGVANQAINGKMDFRDYLNITVNE